MAIILPPASLVKKAYEYWLMKKGDRVAPSRADLDPIEMRPFLSLVALADVRQEPWDFRYRLLGTGIVKHSHADYTGRWMSELDHQQPDSIIFQNCVKVATNKEPLFNATPYVGPQHEFISINEMIAPLSSDGNVIDMLFAVLEFLPKEKVTRTYPRSSTIISGDL